MENKNDEFSGEDDEDDDLENKGETGADNSEDNKLQITKGGKPINKIVEITPGGGFGKVKLKVNLILV